MTKLTPCKACGHQIAKSAKTCPNCGAPNRKTSALVWALLITIILVVISFTLNHLPSGTSRPTSRPIAGRMTESAICSSAGLLIRQSLGKAYRTIDIPCSVAALGNDRVSVIAGYSVPEAMGGHVLVYTAEGRVIGNTLRLETILVHGIDEKPTDFARLAF